MTISKRLIGASMGALLGLTALAGCSDNADETASAGDPDTTNEDGAGTDRVKPNQPDVNEDGTVRIGVLSAGDTNDGGYYEEFVVAARAFTEERGWDLVIVDQVAPSDAATQASNLCRQGADMVAVGATELKDGLDAAASPECEKSVFTVFGDIEEQLSPHAGQVAGQNLETQYLVGRAAGEVLKSRGATTAGYIAGPELDFSVVAAEGFEKGVKAVVPDANVLVSYTGSFDDGGKAREAVTSQVGQGADVIYTYLGGATEAAANAAKDAGALAIAPGTDRCDDERFGVSALFAPGLFFANMLQDFEDGIVEIGVTKIYEVGVDEYPSAKVCEWLDGADEMQDAVLEAAEEIGSGELVVD